MTVLLIQIREKKLVMYLDLLLLSCEHNGGLGVVRHALAGSRGYDLTGIRHIQGHGLAL